MKAKSDFPFGFTLIELLIVIGIIAMLSSLLLLALSRVKAEARNVVCIGNQRQVTLGHRLALEEETGGALGSHSVGEWYLRTVGDAMLGWVCPSTSLQNTNRNAWYYAMHQTSGSVETPWQLGELPIERMWVMKGFENFRDSLQSRIGSYTLNLWSLKSPPSWHDNLNGLANYFVTEGQITEPAKTPLLADGVFFTTQPRTSDVYSEFHLTGITKWGIHAGMESMCIARHGKHPNPVPNNWPAERPLPGAVNVSFFDGHTQAVPLDQLWQLRWHKYWLPPAKRPGLR
ncbi:MAG: prepilin-type N-terminal cleavage/methylation domain-containing protein [Chloroflexi bacterium]|nr:prepilin-type N-terminal cleavage/methylation domain-containing protein [Chloroflexota bacterium]